MASAKGCIKQLAGSFLRLFSRRSAIIFESTPDFADNTYPIYQEMVRRGLHEKYTMVWSCSKDQILADAP